MSHKTIRRVQLAYGILLSVLLVALGVVLMVSCVSIYKEGASPFTPDSIGAAFARIAPLVYVTLGALAVGILGNVVLSFTHPEKAARPQARRSLSSALATLTARADLERCTDKNRTAIRRLRIGRRVILWGAVVLSVIVMLPALVWCLDPANFAVENLNDHIIAATFIILPCAFSAFFVWILAIYLRAALKRGEIALLKKAITAEAKAEAAQKEAKSGKKSKKGHSGKDHAASRKVAASPEARRRATVALWSVRGVLLAVGIVFVVLGVLNGGMADVLGKAVRICTECIGLG